MTGRAPAPGAVPRIVVMGVSGCGKTTIGALVAKTLGVRFVEGDSLHPRANVAKMTGGTPLDDDDRRPWLREIARILATADHGVVVACSALKRAYRTSILAQAPDTRFVHLHGARETLSARMQTRSDHFMPASLLDSQLDDLEPLDDDEPGFAVNIGQPAETIADSVVATLRAQS